MCRRKARKRAHSRGAPSGGRKQDPGGPGPRRQPKDPFQQDGGPRDPVAGVNEKPPDTYYNNVVVYSGIILACRVSLKIFHSSEDGHV